MTWGHKTGDQPLTNFGQDAVYAYNARKLVDRLKQRYAWRWPTAWRNSYEAEAEPSDTFTFSGWYHLYYANNVR